MNHNVIQGQQFDYYYYYYYYIIIYQYKNQVYFYGFYLCINIAVSPTN